MTEAFGEFTPPAHPALNGKFYQTKLDAGVHQETRMQPGVLERALESFGRNVHAAVSGKYDAINKS